MKFIFKTRFLFVKITCYENHWRCEFHCTLTIVLTLIQCRIILVNPIVICNQVWRWNKNEQKRHETEDERQKNDMVVKATATSKFIGKKNFCSKNSQNIGLCMIFTYFNREIHIFIWWMLYCLVTRLEAGAQTKKNRKIESKQIWKTVSAGCPIRNCAGLFSRFYLTAAAVVMVRYFMWCTFLVYRENEMKNPFDRSAPPNQMWKKRRIYFFSVV